MSLLSEFRPALMFLGKFLVLYFLGNILYGVFIESYGDACDPITSAVTDQTSVFLDAIDFNTAVEADVSQPIVTLKNDGVPVIRVFEGCNGVNVMIVFIAFLFAFGGPLKGFLYFLPIGVLIIHCFNILRMSLLFYLAQENSSQFYFYHKYLFTATLYAVVFALWFIWVTKFNERRSVKASA